MNTQQSLSVMEEMASLAKAASRDLALISSEEKNRVLLKMADQLQARKDFLISENQKDVAAAEKMGYSSALVDRLILNEKRITGMMDCLKDTAKLPDPVGDVLEKIHRPNGLMIEKVRTPIGVVGIIYESRPNVTSDCFGLCLKSGNAVILKGGKEALHSNQAIFDVLKSALKDSDIPQAAFQLIESTDRQSVKDLLALDQYVDVIVPRGGEGLIEFVVEHSRIPVIKHYKGLCHVFVSRYANSQMAIDICVNAKVQRPGVCNAVETILIDHLKANDVLPELIQRLQSYDIEVRGCEKTKAASHADVTLATADDWTTEYLDKIVSIKVVDDIKEAVKHINEFGSHHSDAIVTDDEDEARLFLTAVDSSTVYHNASTRFTDGYEFGFGAEVGISTDKLHARGPMALTELTTYKYCVFGQGQIRE